MVFVIIGQCSANVRENIGSFFQKGKVNNIKAGATL